MNDVTKISDLHLISHEYTWAKEEQKKSDMRSGTQAPGRWLRDALRNLSFHNNNT